MEKEETNIGANGIIFSDTTIDNKTIVKSLRCLRAGDRITFYLKGMAMSICDDKGTGAIFHSNGIWDDKLNVPVSSCGQALTFAELIGQTHGLDIEILEENQEEAKYKFVSTDLCLLKLDK
ncbi:MAG: hypothetical protein PHY72_03970 [Candidatus Pacebacteria bacterium]|nr:hypothetical protein [Candidatus Paceibacterota bacterium]